MNRPAAIAVGVGTSWLLPPVPDRWHPVARFGALMGAIERHLWRDRRAAGVVHAAIGAGIGAIAGLVAPTSVAVSVACAGAQLRRHAEAVALALERDDLDGARRLLPALVGRDTETLDAAAVAAAVIESVAENTVDAVAAPIVWAAAAGGVGVGTHRAVNTMDAMVGHRSCRHERYGWASARLDDVMAWLPARLVAALVVLLHPRRATEIVRTIRRDAPAHPSPNAGVAEAAMAGAIGRRLGGAVCYGGRIDHRPVLGVGPHPTAADVRTAIEVSRRLEIALVVLAFVSSGRGRRP